jgi:hypothetical protein
MKGGEGPQGRIEGARELWGSEAGELIKLVYR